jgi:hypothetical protein
VCPLREHYQHVRIMTNDVRLNANAAHTWTYTSGSPSESEVATIDTRKVACKDVHDQRCRGIPARLLQFPRKDPLSNAPTNAAILRTIYACNGGAHCDECTPQGRVPAIEGGCSSSLVTSPGVGRPPVCRTTWNVPHPSGSFGLVIRNRTGTRLSMTVWSFHLRCSTRPQPLPLTCSITTSGHIGITHLMCDI